MQDAVTPKECGVEEEQYGLEAEARPTAMRLLEPTAFVPESLVMQKRSTTSALRWLVVIAFLLMAILIVVLVVNVRKRGGLKNRPPRNGFLYVQLNYGETNNRIVGFARAVLLARRLGRTLILPERVMDDGRLLAYFDLTDDIFANDHFVLDTEYFGSMRPRDFTHQLLCFKIINSGEEMYDGVEVWFKDNCATVQEYDNLKMDYDAFVEMMETPEVKQQWILALVTPFYVPARDGVAEFIGHVEKLGPRLQKAYEDIVRKYPQFAPDKKYTAVHHRFFTERVCVKDLAKTYDEIQVKKWPFTIIDNILLPVYYCEEERCLPHTKENYMNTCYMPVRMLTETIRKYKKEGQPVYLSSDDHDPDHDKELVNYGAVKLEKTPSTIVDAFVCMHSDLFLGNPGSSMSQVICAWKLIHKNGECYLG